MKATPVHTTGGATAEAVPAAPATLLDIDDSLGRLDDLAETIHMMAFACEKNQESAFQAIAGIMQDILTRAHRMLDEIHTRGDEEAADA